MKENRIEDRINNAYCFLNSMHSDFRTGLYYKEDLENLEHILLDYKRVLKENENKTEKIENQKNELAILNDKQKDFNKLQNTLNSYKGQFRRQEKENKELKEKWDNDTHKLQNDLDIANAKIVGLLKENEELKYKYDKSLSDVIAGIDLDNSYIPVQKIKDKIKEIQKEYSKLDKQVDEYINDVNKDLSKYYENKEKIGEMQMLSYFIDNLQELIEEREEK